MLWEKNTCSVSLVAERNKSSLVSWNLTAFTAFKFTKIKCLLSFSEQNSDFGGILKRCSNLYNFHKKKSVCICPVSQNNFIPNSAVALPDEFSLANTAKKATPGNESHLHRKSEASVPCICFRKPFSLWPSFLGPFFIAFFSASLPACDFSAEFSFRLFSSS